MDLADLHRAYEELLARYRAGEIAEQIFLDRVGALRAQDEQGRWWTIGARTGEWYVAQEGEWVQGDPPAELGSSGGAGSQFCPECGAPVPEGATFCGQCGHQMGGHRVGDQHVTSSAGAAGAATVVGTPTPELRPVAEVKESASAPPPPPRPKVERKGRKAWVVPVIAVGAILVLLAAGWFGVQALSGRSPVQLLAGLGGGGESTPLADQPTATSTVAVVVAETATPTPTFISTTTATPPPTEQPATATLAPTDTASPTQTEVPATTTPIQPSPTATAPPATATPQSTATPAPSTATPEPTAEPAPAVLNSVPISNGEYGQNVIWIEHRNAIFVQGGDGHRYKAELGFLSTDEAAQGIQACWDAAGRGGANWKMRIVVRADQSWVMCTSEDAGCNDNFRVNPPDEVYEEVFVQGYVWQSLLNDYLVGGLTAATQNEYYADVQWAVFEKLCGDAPEEACLGFRFERQD